MAKHQLHMCLAGLHRGPDYSRNMNEWFNFGGKPLNDHQARLLVEYGVSKGYRTEDDIPGKEAAKLLKEHESDKVLVLSVTKEWFCMIKQGEKDEEYREIKHHWTSRFLDGKYEDSWLREQGHVVSKSLYWKKYTHVLFVNGRNDNCPRLEKEISCISIGKPTPGMCPKEYEGKNCFIIKFK